MVSFLRGRDTSLFSLNQVVKQNKFFRYKNRDKSVWKRKLRTCFSLQEEVMLTSRENCKERGRKEVPER